MAWLVTIIAIRPIDPRLARAGCWLRGSTQGRWGGHGGGDKNIFVGRAVDRLVQGAVVYGREECVGGEAAAGKMGIRKREKRLIQQAAVE